MDLTQTDSPNVYDAQRAQSDRQRRADPEFQDGSYGFAAKDDEMEVDTEVLGAVKPAVPSGDNTRDEYIRPRNDRRDNQDRGRRDDRRDPRFDNPRDGGRGRPYFDRDRDGGRSRSDYRLHSDDMYPRPRGRGFR